MDPRGQIIVPGIEDYETIIQKRHPATQEKMRWFGYGHLPEGGPRDVSAHFTGLALTLLGILGDGPQFTIALQKLVEAKDCAVRQAIVDVEARKSNDG
jgi:hypothetical protein